jgi:hypothetical protein
MPDVSIGGSCGRADDTKSSRPPPPGFSDDEAPTLPRTATIGAARRARNGEALTKAARLGTSRSTKGPSRTTARTASGASLPLDTPLEQRAESAPQCASGDWWMVQKPSRPLVMLPRSQFPTEPGPSSEPPADIPGAARLPSGVGAASPTGTTVETTTLALAEEAKLSCSMCGTLNPARLQYCESCGVTLRPSAVIASIKATAAPRVEPPPAPVDDTNDPPMSLPRDARCRAALLPVVLPDDLQGATENPACADADMLTSTSDARSPALRIETPMATVTSRPDEDEVRVVVRSTPLLRSMAHALGLTVAVAGALVCLYRWGGVRPEVYVAKPQRNDVAAAAPPPAEQAPHAAALPNAVPAERSDIPAGMGLLNTANAARGRRIYVDGHTAGETPRSVLVKCGTATLKIGSSGRAQTVDVPCGREITLDKP